MTDTPKLIKSDAKLPPDFNCAIGAKGARGKPFPTIDNLRRLLDYYGITYSYNVISKEVSLSIPNQTFTIDNAYNASLAWITSRMEELEMSTKHYEQHLLALCDSNPNNPVANYILSKKWDGISRKKEFYNTITAKDEHMKEVVLYRFLVGAVHGVFSSDGVAGAGCPVLQGSQGLGKGRWIKKLVPENQCPGVLKPEASISPNQKDSEEQTISYWIVELAELEGIFKRSEIAFIKSFLTRAFDVLRKSYGKRAGTYPRRTVFIASVNHRLFLRDTTGNRRFWPITCLNINHAHNIDMQQLWAEIYEDWKAGEQFWLTEKEYEALKELNKEYESVEPVTEAITQAYDWDNANIADWQWKTATEVLQAIDWKDMSKAAVNECGEAIREFNSNQSKRKGNARLVLVPPLKESYRPKKNRGWMDD